MRSPRILAFVLLAVLAARAQTSYNFPNPNFKDTERYSLSGTVVNSVTGEPIRRALVTIFFQQQMAVMTDSNGGFEFEGLPRMRMSATAQKPGFFNEQELTRGGRSASPVMVGPGAPPVVLKLLPEAIISGRILDPDGLPVRELNIHAVTQKIINGRKEWQQGSMARTDADGVYRISNLMPGSYFLIAGPGRAQAFVSGTDDTSDFGYPAVSYPSATTPMRIGAGQQADASFTVKPEPFHSVTGSVSGIVPGVHCSVRLIPRVPGYRMPLFGTGVDAESGTFHIPRIAPGDYTLQANGSDGSRNQFFASLPLSVRRNVMGVTIALAPMMTIPIRVRTEQTRDLALPPGTRNLAGVQLRFTAPDQDLPSAFSTPENPKDPTSPQVMRNVLPGRYRVEVQPNFADSYIAAARLGTIDLLNGEVTLGNSASQGVIDVVIRDDAARMIVKVRAEEEGPVAVLVLPDRGEPRITETTATPNGAEIHLGGFRPGTYAVLVFDTLANLEYGNREALDPYLSHGVRLTLGPNQQSTVTPELIKRGAD